MEATGPAPVRPVQEKVPVEQLAEPKAAPAAAGPTIQITPAPAPSPERPKSEGPPNP